LRRHVAVGMNGGRGQRKQHGGDQGRRTHGMVSSNV
jgi:hypothetical protein